jgi:hypothetical protein
MSWAALGVGALLLLSGGRAEADGVRFGLQGNFGTGLGRGFNLPDGGDANLGAGVRAIWELGLEHEGLAFEASVDVFAKNDRFTAIDSFTGDTVSLGGRYWEFNTNATYARGSHALKFYCGLGVNLAHDTVDRDYLVTGTDNDPLDIGGNLLVGSRVLDHLFVESRLEIRGGGQAMISVGLLL